MYASELNGQRLTFFVSGKLWGRSLVMGDQETGSEWSHILGEAKAGPMRGKRLTIIPSTMTNWKAWSESHPATTVTLIERSAAEFTTDMLRNGDAFGIGLVHQGKSRFWRFDLLAQQPVVNDSLAGQSVVVHYDRETRTPMVWKSTTDTTATGKLTFEAMEQSVRDTQTKSTWDLQMGVATEGKLKGTRLEATTAIVSFRRAWLRFHPTTSQWALPSEPSVRSYVRQNVGAVTRDPSHIYGGPPYHQPRRVSLQGKTGRSPHAAMRNVTSPENFNPIAGTKVR